ncbi:MAG: helix-turn-helix domain-containing protein [Patescibacteria group bacterium]|nr:helix-turn-helix domain-containing protein [Patescibacteria group bacterium]
MATIGHILKNERNKKKISLDEVYIKTKISQRVIALLEEDKFNELPNPSYAKYFIRTYAKFLGLNPEEIASKIYPSKKSDYQTHIHYNHEIRTRFSACKHSRTSSFSSSHKYR